MPQRVFSAQFTKNGVGVPGLTVLLDLERIDLATGDVALTTGLGVTEGNRGVYRYRASLDLVNYHYHAVFYTAGDVDQPEIVAMWTDFAAAVAKDAQGEVTAENAAGSISVEGNSYSASDT